MQRKEAIETLCNNEIYNLSLEVRKDILLSWWYIDEDDKEFHKLPNNLQSEIKQNNNPPLDEALKSKYDPLIIEALKHNYIGVTNEYISEELLKLTKQKTIIEGVAEELYKCPCCNFKTLQRRNEYFICVVCLWEDDGNNENSLDSYSFPNRKTLREAIELYSKTNNTFSEKYYK